MIDFLTFNKFIAPNVLIALYYIFAIGMPIFAVLFYKKFINYFSFLQRVEKELKGLFGNVTFKQKLLFFIVIFFSIIFFEISIRVVFEAMIGYFDIHNFLQGLRLK